MENPHSRNFSLWTYTLRLCSLVLEDTCSRRFIIDAQKSALIRNIMLERDWISSFDVFRWVLFLSLLAREESNINQIIYQTQSWFHCGSDHCGVFSWKFLLEVLLKIHPFRRQEDSRSNLIK